MKQTLDIVCLTNPDRSLFLQRFYETRTPVLIKGHFDPGQAMFAWDHATLKERAGSRPIRVTMAEEGIHFNKQTVAKMTEMPLATYLDHLETGEAASRQLYAAQLRIAQFLPELVAELAYPAYFDQDQCSAANLWYGPGQVSPLHYDAQNNLLLQLKGRKRVLLFAPEELSNLYPYGALSRTPHVSRINLTRDDQSRYPKFAQARCGEVWLEPGDMLYIPLFWWHGVFGYDTNMSINFWYPPTATQARAHPRQLRRAQLQGIRRIAQALIRKFSPAKAT